MHAKFHDPADSAESYDPTEAREGRERVIDAFVETLEKAFPDDGQPFQIHFRNTTDFHTAMTGVFAQAMESDEPGSLGEIILGVDRITYRSVALKFLTRMNRVMEWLRAPKNPEVAWWQVQFALGTIHCEGRTMTSVAAEIGVVRAAISRGATELCRILGVPPSTYMKSQAAQQAFRDERLSQLEEVTTE